MYGPQDNKVLCKGVLSTKSYSVIQTSVNAAGEKSCVFFRPVVCTDLYPTVAPIRYYDVTINIHSHSCGGIELAVALAIRTKLQQEFSLCVENLHVEIETTM